MLRCSVDCVIFSVHNNANFGTISKLFSVIGCTSFSRGTFVGDSQEISLLSTMLILKVIYEFFKHSEK